MSALIHITSGTGLAQSTAAQLARMGNALHATPTMPVLFLGHGSPMNIITDNRYNQSWRALGRRFGAGDDTNAFPHPQLILCISAHWATNGRGFWLTGQERPETIHDFGGFPPALYAQRYPAPGAPKLAEQIQTELKNAGQSAALEYQDWGFDHGSWGVLLPMFPEAQIPTLQLSIDMRQSPEAHWRLGQALQSLRQKGVLIVGSGNVVHNLRAAMQYGETVSDWGTEFDHHVHQAVTQHQPQRLTHWSPDITTAAQMAHPSVDHYLPLLTAMGAVTSKDKVEVFNDDREVGAISMRSFLWQAS